MINIKKSILTLSLLILAGMSLAKTPAMNWNIEFNKPLNQIIFPIKMNETAPKNQFDFANHFGFTDGAQSGIPGRMHVSESLEDTFVLKVSKKNNLLTRKIVNTNTGREDTINQRTVGDTAATLSHHQVSCIENYPMGDFTCDKNGWPYYETKFFPPTGNNGKIKRTLSGLSHGSSPCPGAIT